MPPLASSMRTVKRGPSLGNPHVASQSAAPDQPPHSAAAAGRARHTASMKKQSQPMPRGRHPSIQPTDRGVPCASACGRSQELEQAGTTNAQTLDILVRVLFALRLVPRCRPPAAPNNAGPLQQQQQQRQQQQQPQQQPLQQPSGAPPVAAAGSGGQVPPTLPDPDDHMGEEEDDIEQIVAASDLSGDPDGRSASGSRPSCWRTLLEARRKRTRTSK